MYFPAGHTPTHWINIGVHVLFGSAALLLGLGAILTPKGGLAHRRFGRWFLYSYGVVVLTATIGLLVFEFRSFLAVVTLLSLYDAFAGFRALQLRGARPTAIDLTGSVIGFAAPWIFVATMHRLHQPWSPVLTWSILGGLILMSTYDLLRTVLPIRWLRRFWVQEHLVKMMCAYIAITTAFAGTVFPRFMPWSAILPTVGGWLTVRYFLVAGPRLWQRRVSVLNRRPT
jgi:hypothetical protein